MSKKYALVIGNTEYTDPGLAQLTAPSKDVENFAQVLRSKEICNFDDVRVFVNEPSSSVITEIDEFFDQKKPDDLLVLYFSGHGIKDENGSLYLGFKNTNRSRLRSSAIKSDYIREAMDQSRSRRQVLILDCCNSGAFPQGTKADIGGLMGFTKAFQGYGRFVLTASDSTQFAWEGNKFIGKTDNSLFTHFLVKGLEGEADNNGDGNITVDELYDYSYEQVSKATPKQTPTKSSSHQEGEIILRRNININDIKPIPLPSDLLISIENSIPDIRLAAIEQLTKLLNGKNLGLAHSAKNELERIAREDDSRRVSEVAQKSLLQTKSQSQKNTTHVIPEKKTSEQRKKEIAKNNKTFLIPIAVFLCSLLAFSLLAGIYYFARPEIVETTPFKLTQTPLINTPSENSPVFTSKTPTSITLQTPTKMPTSFSANSTSTALQSCNLTYCENSSEPFCIYSIAPQPTGLIVALKYNQEINSSNLPQLIVGSQKFKCELLVAYPGRIYCNGASVEGATKLMLMSSTNATICSGAFTIKKFVAFSPTPKKDNNNNPYP